MIGGDLKKKMGPKAAVLVIFHEGRVASHLGICELVMCVCGWW